MTQVNLRMSGVCAFFTMATPPRMLMLNASDTRNTSNGRNIIESHQAIVRWPFQPPTPPASADVISPRGDVAAVLLRGEFISIVSNVIADGPTFRLDDVPLFGSVAGGGYTLKMEYAYDDPFDLNAKDVLGRVDFAAGTLDISRVRRYRWHFFPSVLTDDIRVPQEVQWTFDIQEAALTLELVEFEMPSAKRRIEIAPIPPSPIINLELCNCMEADLFPVQPLHDHIDSPDWHFELFYKMYRPPANARRPAVPYFSGWGDPPEADAASENVHGGNCPPIRGS